MLLWAAHATIPQVEAVFRRRRDLFGPIRLHNRRRVDIGYWEGYGGFWEWTGEVRAIVFKPFEGEVVGGVVHNVTRVRILTRGGVGMSWFRISLSHDTRTRASIPSCGTLLNLPVSVQLAPRSLQCHR